MKETGNNRPDSGIGIWQVKIQASVLLMRILMNSSCRRRGNFYLRQFTGDQETALEVQRLQAKSSSPLRSSWSPKFLLTSVRIQVRSLGLDPFYFLPRDGL